MEWGSHAGCCIFLRNLQCEAGVTPNPDLACNRHIKFGALLKHCKRMGADAVATGHYARIGHCASTGQLQLLRGVDALKDQSYFLASIQGQSLAGRLPHLAWLAVWLTAMGHNLLKSLLFRV
jgi:tRNA U34 2-thiouridine synthase MnmA/TrmU